MNAIVRRFTAAGVGAALAAGLVAGVAADATECIPLTSVQQRLLDKADQGVGALRNYIFITRGIYQLYIADVADSLPKWRARAACAKQAAEAAAARDTATAKN